MDASNKKYVWLCIHCQTPLDKKFSKPQPNNDPVFCCNGCKIVYQILKKNNLDQYYDIKKDAPFLCPASPVEIKQNKYDYLESEEVLKKYAYGENLRQMDFFIEGIHCVACLWLIERIGILVPGVAKATLDLSKSVLRVTLKEEGKFSLLAATLQQLGYTPHPIESNEELVQFKKKEDKELMLKLGTAGFCAGNIMLLFISIYAGATGQLLNLFLRASFLLVLPVIFYAAIPFYKSAISSLRVREINIDVPVSVALIVGFIASTYHLLIGSKDVYFDSLSVFVFLLLSTRLFLKSLHQKISGTTHYSELLMPQFVFRYDVKSDSYINTALEEVKAGDIVRISEKTMIPVDGVMEKGEGYVDLHMLTGESQPVLVKKGSDVFAGTTNQDAEIFIKVTETGSQTRLAKIFKSIEQAQKPKIVTLADQVAKWFLMAVIGLGLAVFTYFVFFNVDEGIKRALSLIIIACPCALALATPFAYTMGLKKSAAIGALLKGPEGLERLALVKKVFLDKTGTLTHGGFTVLSWEPIKEEDSLFAIAYALEKESKHPIASAIRGYVEQQVASVDSLKVEGYLEKIGKGVSGTINGQHYEIKGYHAPTSTLRTSDDIQTQIGIYREGQFIVRIVLGDKIRSTSYGAVKKLNAKAFDVCMLTGDNKQVAQAVAERLDINAYEAPIDPEQKQKVIENADFSLMVGDGANDAAALASAFVSIAVQGSLEVSFKSADVYLARPGIDVVPLLLTIAQKTRATVKRNLGISIAYNVIGITAAALGWITPLIAAVVMPISSITVLLSSYFGLSRKETK